MSLLAPSPAVAPHLGTPSGQISLQGAKQRENSYSRGAAPPSTPGPSEATQQSGGGMLRTISGSGRCGSTDGTRSSASFNAPHGVCALRDGSLLVTDRLNDAIRHLRPGKGSTLSSMCPTYGSRSISKRRQWQLQQHEGWTASTIKSTVPRVPSIWHRPLGLCAAEDHPRTAIVCDAGHHRIRVVRLPSAQSTLFSPKSRTASRTVAGRLQGARTRVQAAGDGNSQSTGRARSLHADTDTDTDMALGKELGAGAIVALLAGSGVRGHRDGLAHDAAFNSPSGCCIAADGAIIVADSANHCIRRISRHSRFKAATAGKKMAHTGHAHLADARGIASTVVTAATAHASCEAGRHRAKRCVAATTNQQLLPQEAQLPSSRAGTPRCTSQTQRQHQPDPCDASTKGCQRAGRRLDSDDVDPTGDGKVTSSDSTSSDSNGSALVVTTIAGAGASGHSSRGGQSGFQDGPGNKALFCCPCSVVIAFGNRILVVDKRNHAVRVLVPPAAAVDADDASSWRVLTVAGAQGEAGHIDGPLRHGSVPATYSADDLSRVDPCAIMTDSRQRLCTAPAKLKLPTDAVILADGSVIVCDSGNHVLRRLALEPVSAMISQHQRRNLSYSQIPWVAAHTIEIFGNAAAQPQPDLAKSIKIPTAADSSFSRATVGTHTSEPPLFAPRGIVVLEDHTESEPKSVTLCVTDGGNHCVRIVTLSGTNLDASPSAVDLLSAHCSRSPSHLPVRSPASYSVRHTKQQSQQNQSHTQSIAGGSLVQAPDFHARRLLEQSAARARARVGLVSPVASLSPPPSQDTVQVPSSPDPAPGNIIGVIGRGTRAQQAAASVAELTERNEALVLENYRLRALLKVAADKIDNLVAQQRECK